MKVKECMCNYIYSCTPSTTIFDIAKIMQEKHVGAIPICDNENCLIGIITDRDITLRCVATDKNAKDTTASDIMTTKVSTCTLDDEIEDAQNIMSNEKIRRLPVVDNNGKVIGMLSIGDLAVNDIEIGQSEVSDTLNSICEIDEENKNSD